MLRLTSSQVGLGSRDLAWHKDRYQARQLLRNSGQRVQIIGLPHNSSQRTPDNLMPESPDDFPRLPFSPESLHRSEEDSDDDLFSNEPVPQGSRIFWDRIMANAGAPRGMHVQHVDRRLEIIEKSRASHGVVRSSKGSVEGTAEAHDFSESIAESVEGTDDADLAFQFSRLQSRFSTESDAFSSIGLEEEMRSGNRTAEQPLVSNPSSAPALVSSSRPDLVRGQREHSSRKVDQLSASMELDGSSDLRRHEIKGHAQGASRPSDKHHRDSRARNQSTERATSRWQPRLEAGPSRRTSSPSSDPCKQNASPRLPAFLTMEGRRRRSSGLQGSSLRISHAVASSSPEKQSPESVDQSIEAMVAGASSSEQQSLLEMHPCGEGVSEASVMHLPFPRRRKKYTISAYSSSMDPQKVSPPRPDSPQRPISLSNPFGQGQSTSSLTSFIDPNNGPPIITSSPPELPTPSPSSAPHRRLNLNPEAPPFIPSSSPPMPTPRRLFPSFTLSTPSPASLPSRPFSATPRSVSFSGSLPSPAPSSPPTPSPPSPAPLSPPFTTIRLSLSPPTAALRVYNDQLPATSQPQTPAQIPRYGRASHVPAPTFAQTVPAAHRRAIWLWQTFAARTLTLEDQENVGVGVEGATHLTLRRRARRERDALGEGQRGSAGAVVGGGRGLGRRREEGIMATTPE